MQEFLIDIRKHLSSKRLQRKRPQSSKRLRLGKAVFFLSLAYLGIARPCFAQSEHNLPDLGESSSLELSSSEAFELKNKIRASLLREENYIDDWEINQYFQQILQKLSKSLNNNQENNQTEKLQSYVFNRSEVNAFATFGGQIGIFSGLMLLSNNEDEIAGVLAHELAHLRQGHLFRQQSKNRQIGISQIVGMIATILAIRSGNGQLPQAAISATNALGAQASLSYSREFEQEADRVGLQILRDSDYSPLSLADFLQKMYHKYRANDNHYSEYIRSHPLTLERIFDLRQRTSSESNSELNKKITLPQNDYHFIKAKLQVMSMSKTEAVNHFKLALAQQENFKELDYYRYGYALALVGERSYSEALQQLQLISAENANNLLVIRLQSQVKLQLDAHQGLKNYQEIWQKNPNNLAIAMGYVEALQLNKKYSQAIELTEKILQQNEDNISIFEQLAKLYAENKQNAMQHRTLGKIYLQIGEYLTAVEQYNLALNSKDANYYQLAIINAELKEAEQLLRNHPESNKSEK